MNEYELREILRNEEERKSGVIYAVEYEDGIVKIGFTTNIQRRLYQLRTVYRGKEYTINKICVSECVANVRKKERDVLNGFTPIPGGKKECFIIPFEIAVDKIKTVCGRNLQIYADGLDDIISNHHELCYNAINPCVAFEYYMNKVINEARQLGLN